MAREIFLGLQELGSGDGLVPAPLGLPRSVHHDILRPFRTFFRLPFEALENPLVFLQLDRGIGVTLDFLIIDQVIDIPVQERR